MKDFDNSFLTILASEEAVAFWLVDMQISVGVHQYFTTLDVDIVIDGNRYISTDMSIDPVNYSVGMSVSKMRLEFENVSLTMSATLLNNNVTGQPMIIYGGVTSSGLDISLINGTAYTTITGNTAKKTSGGGAWDADVYSLNSFTSGAVLRFQAMTDDKHQMIGLNQDPTTDHDYTSIDYCFAMRDDSTARIYESGVNIAAMGAYTIDTVFEIKYDGTDVIYLIDGVVKRTVPSVGSDLEFFIDSSMFVDAEFRILSFEPYDQINTEIVFRGLTSDWSLDEKKAEISVVDEFVYWNKRSLRKPGPLCPWDFKGIECGYSGTQTLCNKSYARCSDLGRTDSFGGFKFFPAMEEKEIWWGKQS